MHAYRAAPPGRARLVVPGPAMTLEMTLEITLALQARSGPDA